MILKGWIKNSSFLWLKCTIRSSAETGTLKAAQSITFGIPRIHIRFSETTLRITMKTILI